jgi:predicted transcriptional regulator
MPTLTIRIDEKLEKDLEEMAASQHRSKSEVARDILRRRLAVERFQQLRNQTLPFAEAAGYLTDEDIFKDIS